MEAYYFALREVHVGAVIASGALFLLRALAVNVAGAAWPMTRPVRLLAYAVDTVLLAAALLLTTVIGQYPFVNAWLTVKVLLLLVYVVLGYRALRARSRAARLICLAGAVAAFLLIVSVARAHDPLGLFASLLRAT